MIPTGLLVSYARSCASHSLRYAAQLLNIPHASLALFENFEYIPPDETAEDIADYVTRIAPPNITLPLHPEQVKKMLERDRIFFSLLPLLENSYHSSTSRHAVGSLFLTVTDLYVSHLEEFGTIALIAPADPTARTLLTHLLYRYDLLPDIPKKEKDSFVETHTSRYIALFTHANVYDILHPVPEGKKCYFAHIFLYILLHRIALYYDPTIQRSDAYLPARNDITHHKLLTPDEATHFWHKSGTPLPPICDMLVLHAPVSYAPHKYVTILTPSLSDPAAYTLTLAGDALEIWQGQLKLPAD